MCIAVAFFACLDASAKWLAVRAAMDPVQIVLVRYLGSVVLVSLILNPWSRPGILRTRRPWLQGWRSLLLFAATIFNFFALKYLQLAETVSIMFATPLLVALISGPMLGEWPGPRRIAAILVGFAGVLIITRPGFGGLPAAALLSLTGCIAYSLYSIITRMLAAHDSPETTMVYSGVAGTVLLLPVIPFFWTTPTDPTTWVVMAVFGAFGAVGHWLLILAHRLAPASILSPFIYSQIVWMIGLGWLLFEDWPDLWTFAGAGVVIGSGLYLLYRERVRAVPHSSASLD